MQFPPWFSFARFAAALSKFIVRDPRLSRLDLSTGGNSRSRRRLLGSARVAPARREYVNFFSIFGAVIFENFRVQTQFSAKKFRK